MFEPISIAITATQLVETCTKIYTIVNQTRHVDASIGVLGVEINSLCEVLNAMHESFNDPALATIDMQTGHEAQHWRNVKRSLQDCTGTLKCLGEILDALKRSGGRFLQRPRKQINLQLKLREIGVLKQQVTSYRQTMQLSMQLLTAYVSDSHHCQPSSFHL
jgi:hypothetical protein